METIATLLSVGFGATLTYIFQWLSESRKHKKELKKEKIIIFSNILKDDILNGPKSHYTNRPGFDDESFKKVIYPLMLGKYYYFPKKVRDNFNDINNILKDLEYNDIPEDISDRNFYEHIDNLYRQSIEIIKKEIEELIN